MTTQELEILEVHNIFWDGLCKRDLEKRFSVCSEDITFFGTAQHEHAIGIKQYREFNERGLLQNPDPFEMETLWFKVSVLSDVAWVESNVLFVENVNGKEFRENTRLTTIFKKENNKWKVAHVHGSQPDYRLQEGEYELTEDVLERNRFLEKEVFDRTLELTNQKVLIEGKQQEILESIAYAKGLQQALLPPKEFLDYHIPANFVLYKPKDIVSGDFYWLEALNDKFYIAVADSTGHGVPGAMVSLICLNALNRSVKEFNETETGKILDKTRELVVQTFEKSIKEVKDGMDVSLLCIDSRNKTISWSGAYNPLWYITNDEILEIKADRQAIGKVDNPRPFTTHQIEYKQGSTFYLFTDGIADQFGGPNGKKFKYKQLSEVLTKNSTLPMAQQSSIIYKIFEEWKGGFEQIDDVCLIGIKI